MRLGFHGRSGFRSRGTARLPSTTFEGQVLVPAGTANAPSIADKDDPNTGLNLGSAGYQLIANGTQTLGGNAFTVSAQATTFVNYGAEQNPADGAVSWGADQTALALGNGVRYYVVTVTAAGVDLNTILASSDGRVITFIVSAASANSLTVKDESAALGAAADRICLRGGVDAVLTPGEAITLVYSTADSRWHEV